MKSPDGQKYAEWRSMLAATPVRNEAARVLKNEENAVSVSVRNQKPGYRIPPISWFVPYKPVMTIELDGPGAKLWHCCDGNHTVEQICDIFSRDYKLTFHEAKTAVTDYLRKLIQRGVLAIMLKEDK